MFASEKDISSERNKSSVHVLIIEFQNFKRTVYLEKPTYSIGRSLENTIVISSQQVSRYHATLIRRTNVKDSSFSYWILDGDLQGNRSTNGVLINKKKCLVRELQHGDIIELSADIKVRYYNLTNVDSSQITPRAYSSSEIERGSRKAKPLQSTEIILEPDWTELKQEHPKPGFHSQVSSSSIDRAEESNKYSEAERGSAKRLGRQKLKVPPEEVPAAALGKLNEDLGEGEHRGYAERGIECAPAQAQYQDFYDYVTDLPNRTLFDEQFSIAFALAKRHQQAIATLYIDLNCFRSINDTFGYSVGDLLLKSFAERVKFCLRSGDVFARWGGDKFAILLPQIDRAESAAKVSRRILAALESPFAVGQYQIQLKVSIGIAVYPQDGEDTETLLEKANVALERNREHNSGYQFYNAAIASQASELSETETLLQHVLEAGEFQLYYQPQVNINTKKICSAESLLRWHRPEFGQISPAELISLADTSGLAIPLTEWVLQTACAQNKAWQQAGLPPLRVAVNLSCQQFQQPNLVDTVVQVLRKTGLEPCWLELEIKEAALLENPESCQSIYQLQVMGVKISIDDFGTGYSSLRHLQEFPLCALKIDRSLVRDLSKKQQNRKTIAAAVALGNIFGVDVVAKGVETSQQLNLLRRLQCEKMQGYLFSRPLETEKLTQLLLSFASHQ